MIVTVDGFAGEARRNENKSERVDDRAKKTGNSVAEAQKEGYEEKADAYSDNGDGVDDGAEATAKETNLASDQQVGKAARHAAEETKDGVRNRANDAVDVGRSIGKKDHQRVVIPGANARLTLDGRRGLGPGDRQVRLPFRNTRGRQRILLNRRTDFPWDPNSMLIHRSEQALSVLAKGSLGFDLLVLRVHPDGTALSKELGLRRQRSVDSLAPRANAARCATSKHRCSLERRGRRGLSEVSGARAFHSQRAGQRNRSQTGACSADRTSRFAHIPLLPDRARRSGLSRRATSAEPCCQSELGGETTSRRSLS